jgi:RNase P/RNase MRP subunit POP5
MRYPKKRYILVFSKDEVDEIDLLRTLRRKIVELFGAFGIIKSNLRIFKTDANFFIVRTNHYFEDEVLFALDLIDLQGKGFTTLKTSGTMAKLKTFIIEFSLKIIK